MIEKVELLSLDETKEIQKKCRKVLDAVNGVILGKSNLVRLVFATIMARGHVLLEGLPGLGKTVLVKTFASALGVAYNRIQFTPDLLPSDVTGSFILEGTEQGRKMKFYQGPVFTNLLLADEINRASPKTQSALLEAMGETQVTQLGETMPLAAPFCVLATQNPIELEGTYPLPEAQLDRFAVKLHITSTDKDVLKKIICERKDGLPSSPSVVMNKKDLLSIQSAVEKIHLPDAVAEHISYLVASSDPDNCEASEEVKGAVQYGASPRAAIWLTLVAKALALIDGRPGVGFEDVRYAGPAVLGHRIILVHTARLDGKTGFGLATSIIDSSERRIIES